MNTRNACVMELIIHVMQLNDMLIIATYRIIKSLDKTWNQVWKKKLIFLVKFSIVLKELRSH